MITPPNEPYTTATAAIELNKSQRQVERYLKCGALGGRRCNGRWQTTAIDIWKYQGIAEDMTRLWLEYCERRTAPVPKTEAESAA